jgi:hypothetical protein
MRFDKKWNVILLICFKLQFASISSAKWGKSPINRVLLSNCEKARFSFLVLLGICDKTVAISSCLQVNTAPLQEHLSGQVILHATSSSPRGHCRTPSHIAFRLKQVVDLWHLYKPLHVILSTNRKYLYKTKL